jgi:hypothetical protein
MIRFFYLAVACLLLSVCIEHGLAQTVQKAPNAGDTAAVHRYQSPLDANMNRAPGLDSTDQQLLRERCAWLDSMADHPGSNTSTARERQLREAQGLPNDAWGTRENWRLSDDKNELARQAAMLGCPRR